MMRNDSVPVPCPVSPGRNPLVIRKVIATAPGGPLPEKVPARLPCAKAQLNVPFVRTRLPGKPDASTVACSVPVNAPNVTSTPVPLKFSVKIDGPPVSVAVPENVPAMLIVFAHAGAAAAPRRNSNTQVSFFKITPSRHSPAAAHPRYHTKILR